MQRDERTDPALIPAAVAATAMAVATVVVTQLIEETAQCDSVRLGKWLFRANHEGKIELSIRKYGEQTTKTLTVPATVSEADVMHLLRHDIGGGEIPAGDDA